MREEKLLRKREEGALDRWRVLMRAVVTRRRLRAAYQEDKEVEGRTGGAELISVDAEEQKADWERGNGRDGRMGKESGDGVMMGGESAVLRSCSGGEGREVNGASERGKKGVVKITKVAKGKGGKVGERNGNEDASHVHRFLEVDEQYEEESGIRIKICSCGFSEEVEEI